MGLLYVDQKKEKWVPPSDVGRGWGFQSQIDRPFF